METETLIWIIVAVVVAVLILGLLAWLLSKRQTAQRRTRAGELRDEAASRASALEESDVAAREAEVEADRARYEAEQAQVRAHEARKARTQEEAHQEDKVREADRLDPDTDTSSDEYRPNPPSGGAHRAT